MLSRYSSQPLVVVRYQNSPLHVDTGGGRGRVHASQPPPDILPEFCFPTCFRKLRDSVDSSVISVELYSLFHEGTGRFRQSCVSLMSTLSKVSIHRPFLLGQSLPALLSLCAAADIPSFSLHSPLPSLTRNRRTCKTVPLLKHQPSNSRSFISHLAKFPSVYTASTEEKEQLAYPCKIRMSGFDVKVEKVEHNTIRQIAKATVVDNQSFSCIHHLHAS